MEPVGPVLTFLDFCGTIPRVFKKKLRYSSNDNRHQSLITPPQEQDKECICLEHNQSGRFVVTINNLELN